MFIDLGMEFFCANCLWILPIKVSWELFRLRVNCEFFAILIFNKKEVKMKEIQKKILCFSGWGQKFDSLEVVFKDDRFSNFDVESFDYSKFFGYDEFLRNFKVQNLTHKFNPDILVGWSLGGQICLKLIANGLLRPKTLVLIAPPFQMVKDERIKAAMGQDVFKEFYENFANSPDATLKKFSILAAMNDKNASQIAKTLDINDENHKQLISWLNDLKNTSFFDFDFGKIPQTLFFQGKGDMIVHASQMLHFQEKIKDFTAFQYENCGHAAHLSDLERIRGDLLRFL